MKLITSKKMILISAASILPLLLVIIAFVNPFNQQKKGTLIIDIVPSDAVGATVYATNNEGQNYYICSAPCITALSPGSYKITISKENYIDYKAKILIKKNKTTVVKAKMIMEGEDFFQKLTPEQSLKEGHGAQNYK